MNDRLDEEIIRIHLQPTDDPASAIAREVAELEHADATDLPTMYGCIDGILDELFSNPPSPEAQLEITFSYLDYRITLGQDGHARLIKVV